MHAPSAALRFLNLLSPAVGLLLGTTILSAQPALWELGTLTCTLAGDDGAAPAEKGKGREALCNFRPGDSGAEETYVASLQFVTQDGRQPRSGSTIMLAVKAPFSTKLVPGLLEQSYAADASTSGAKQLPLAGQKLGSLVLHPELGASGEPSMALGPPNQDTLIIAELKLRSSPG
jgi:hypothetical protein